nr:retrovirus-related Pol polyprotein from transposon TNT 1-94 [Tanacetum cinerariifolium]
MMASSPICLLSKASKTKSWLWHRCLSHLNFGAINHLARQGLVRGLPKLIFEKDHLCLACAMGKSTKKSHKPKTKDTNKEKLYLLHMDLCGPMRVESVNGKKYILVIVDDYSRFTWVKFLRSKDEAPDCIIKFLKMIQVRLKVPVHRIQTDNKTEFVNQTLRKYYEEVGISNETSVARSPQQNGIVERRNRTLIEATRTILDELTTMASKQRSSGPTLNEMNPTTISLGLVQKSSSSTPYVPPSRNDWDLMFQPMFDELLNPSPSVDHQAAQVITLMAEVIPQVQDDSTVIPQDVEEDNLDIEVAHMRNDPLLGVPILEVTYAQSSSTMYKDALAQSCWIETMQEELNEFERLELWELVPRLDKVMPDGFVDQDNPNHVYKLKKALYGLKQAPRTCGLQWWRNENWIRIKKGRPLIHRITVARPIEKHIHAVKRIFRYLRGTVHRGLWYPKDFFVALTVFADVDHAGCQDTRRSTSGSVQFLGERLISWSSKRKKSVAISSMEAEYITTMDTTIEQQAIMDEALVPHAQRDMLHICPRIHGQSFDEPPFKEEILAFIHFLGHSAVIRTLTDFGALLPIELTNEEIKNYNAYKEYYAIATGAAPPKPKASVRRTRSSSNTSITPPTDAAGPRLTNEGTGSIPRVSDVPTDESEEEFSWNSTDDEGDADDGKDGDDDEEEGGDDDQEYDDEYAEETRDEESFDPITQTPKNNDNEGNGKEDIGLNIGGEEGHDKKEEEDELYRDVNINQGRGIQANLEVKDSYVILTPVNPNGMESIFKTTSQLNVQTPTSMAPLPMTTPTMTPSTIATITITSQAPILPTTVLSSIIQNLPNFGSLFRFDDRLRNLYKALVEAYESNKIILDTYEETVTLKRRRDDDADKDEEPSAGPDRGSKRHKEGNEPESASAPTETTTRSAGRSTVSTQSRVSSLIPNNQGRHVIPFEHFINNNLEYLRGGASSRKYTTSITKTKAADYGHIKWIEDLVPRTMWIEEPIGYDKYSLWGRRIIAVTELKIVEYHSYKHLDWITVRRDDDKIYKFKEGDFKRLRIQDIEDMLLLLVQDDRLKGIRMQYLPKSIRRKSEKDRAAAMIQAIDKGLKIKRIMRSLERFVGGRL